MRCCPSLAQYWASSLAFCQSWSKSLFFKGPNCQARVGLRPWKDQKGQHCLYMFHNIIVIIMIFIIIFCGTWPLAGTNFAKKMGRSKNGRGVIGAPIVGGWTFENGAYRHPKPTILGFIGSGRLNLGRKWIKITVSLEVLAASMVFLDISKVQNLLLVISSPG